MFKAARWRSEKNRFRAVFKLQLRATQVPRTEWEAVMVTLVPVDVGKPSQRTEKTAIVNGECQWLSPIYETVKLVQDQKTRKISDKVYQFIVSASGSTTYGVLGEIRINFADYAELLKSTSVSLPLQDSNDGVILHVNIQRVQSDAEGRETAANGEIPKVNVNQRQRTLLSQLSKPVEEEDRSAANGENDTNSTEEESIMNSKALVTLHSRRNMPPYDGINGNLRQSSSTDSISASGSESSSGIYTPKENGYERTNRHLDNPSLLSPRPNSDILRITDGYDRSVAGSTNSFGETELGENMLGSDNTLERQKSDPYTLARQLELSELELQTLRKQVVKERRRGQDLSRELNSLQEERDALRKECEDLKASKKRAANNENVSAMLQFGAKDPWSMVYEMKGELEHEKNLNANLRIQLQKTQESNSELMFAVRDLEELLEQKNRGKSYSNEDSQETECQNQLLHLRNLEFKQEESLKTSPDHKEEQSKLDQLVAEHSGIKVVHLQDQRILDLSSELELYKKDREDLEMQMEQIALDYEILKQENHDISSRLEQVQLREQLKMQYECSAHLAIINDLESHVESLEKQLEKKAEEYEANIVNIVKAKVEHEQRAIRLDEELRTTRWKNANTVEQLQQEFKRLSSQLSTTFYANENLVTKTLEESRELRLEKCHMAMLLEKKNEELSSLQRQHQVKCQQLLSLIDFKSKEVDKLILELKDKRLELESQKRAEEARQKASEEEMSILKTEIDQLSREKGHLSSQLEQKEKLVAEIESLKTSTKEVEMMLQERNLESNMFGKEVLMLKEEAKKSLEELNSLRHLKDEQEAAIKTLDLKIRTLVTQYADDNDNKNFDNDNCPKLNGDHLQEKLVQEEEFMNYSLEDHSERIISNLDANTKKEVESLDSCTYGQCKIAEVLSQMEELKEQKESMEAELKEMQERYSEMSLRFAEVEGERQQLVIRMRSLKNATKN